MEHVEDDVAHRVAYVRGGVRGDAADVDADLVAGGLEIALLAGEGVGEFHGLPSVMDATAMAAAPVSEPVYPEAVLGSGLDAHGGEPHSKRGGDGPPHGRDVLREMGTLENDCSIDVDHTPSGPAEHGDGALQERRAGDALRHRGVVGLEVRADVAEGSSPQQRVDDGMRYNVAVAVAGEPALRRDAHPAQRERHACLQCVCVVAYAEPRGHRVILRRGVRSEFSIGRGAPERQARVR